MQVILSAPGGLTEQLPFSIIEKKNWACFLLVLEVSSASHIPLVGWKKRRSFGTLGLSLPIYKV